MNTVIIGFGDLAPKYVEVLNELNHNIIGVVGRDFENTINKTKMFKLNTFRTISEIKLEKIDFFTVLVSPENNYNVLNELIPLKKPILIEKPIVFSSKKIDELIELNKNYNTKIMVALNRRFYSVFEKGLKFLKNVKKPIDSIVIEAPERFSDINHPKFSKIVRENWMFSNSVHCVDLIRFFGGDVTEMKINSKTEEFSFSAIGKCQKNIDFIYLSNWKSQDKWSVSLYADNVKILYQPLEKGEIIEGSKKIQISPEKSDIEFKPGVYKQTKFFVENVVLGKDTNISFQNLEEHKKTVQLIEEIFCRK